MTFNGINLTSCHFKSTSNYLKTTSSDLKMIFNRAKSSSIHLKRSSSGLQSTSNKLKLTLSQVQGIMYEWIVLRLTQNNASCPKLTMTVMNKSASLRTQ